ncbi:hypothetical protein MJG53_013884 [Ovis ammon polii x Ovis aries]|uniref:Uncharacterized protein n=1 Tax=Ovis ammon polii x Ovis aries TaxID=2918886 RepID=A0ACB9UK58_9CETA|nr:hypothetical protein MJG53_013884 [Ovis ammon polii x Ovis aries]
MLKPNGVHVGPCTLWVHCRLYVRMPGSCASQAGRAFRKALPPLPLAEHCTHVHVQHRKDKVKVINESTQETLNTQADSGIECLVNDLHTERENKIATSGDTPNKTRVLQGKGTNWMPCCRVSVSARVRNLLEEAGRYRLFLLPELEALLGLDSPRLSELLHSKQFYNKPGPGFSIRWAGLDAALLWTCSRFLEEKPVGSQTKLKKGGVRENPAPFLLPPLLPYDEKRPHFWNSGPGNYLIEQDLMLGRVNVFLSQIH